MKRRGRRKGDGRNVSFKQQPPRLGNQYEDDRALRSLLRRALAPEVLAEVEPSLSEMGEIAGGELYRLQLEDRESEPALTGYDAWGERVDRVSVTPLWRAAERIAAERGLVATAYERRHGRYSRLHQAALAYLFAPSSDLYSCPLAMTDGAARALLASGNGPLCERVVPRLTTRDPERFWTSGQWMTERAGGSDVSRTETVARRDGEGRWRLYGEKWFASAANSHVALALARPEGGEEGSRGLALFLVETRDDEGRLANIRIERLKDKLGTRKLPTAELALDGARAELVAGASDGVRSIAPMLNVTRLWNGLSAAALMRRGVALARDYARRRTVFGSRLSEKPLHADTLAWMQAETEAALHLAFRAAELVGREESGELNDEGTRLLRLLTPVMKLTTARQAVAVASETLECFGGAGYVEDTGLPVLLRDAQVLTIWEGTTNVLALDALRVVDKDARSLASLRAEMEACVRDARDERLKDAALAALAASDEAARWLAQAEGEGRGAVEAGARRFSMTLGRSFALALLVRHAQWSLDAEGDERALASARRFAASGVNLIARTHMSDALALSVEK